MSKAEDRALEAYPSTSHYCDAEPDRNAEAREYYKQGYKQAEKDLALTCSDMELIYNLSDDIPKMAHDDFFEELLIRYNEKKKELI